MMIRKTIALKDETFASLRECGIVSERTVFSELVDSALKDYMQNFKKEQYKKAIAEAAKDKLYLADIAEVEDDFAFSDKEVSGAV